MEVIIVCLALVLLALLLPILWQYVHIVASRHRAVALHRCTLQRRRLDRGCHCLWPWESLMSLRLPVHGRLRKVDSFYDSKERTYRYDPPPYAAITRDQVPVWIDLSIDYAIIDMDEALDADRDDYAELINDEGPAVGRSPRAYCFFLVVDRCAKPHWTRSAA